MTAVSMNFQMNWGVASDDDARYNQIARNNLLVAILLGVLIPFLPLPEIEQPVPEEPP